MPDLVKQQVIKPVGQNQLFSRAYRKMISTFTLHEASHLRQPERNSILELRPAHDSNLSRRLGLCELAFPRWKALSFAYGPYSTGTSPLHKQNETISSTFSSKAVTSVQYVKKRRSRHSSQGHVLFLPTPHLGFPLGTARRLGITQTTDHGHCPFRLAVCSESII